MNLFFDEDTGTGIPRAVRLLRLPSVDHVVYPGSAGPLPKGTSDPDWIAFVGSNDYLAFSQNRLILASDVEREAAIKARAGIIFVGTGQERSWLVMKLLLNQWSWVLDVHQQIARPFASHLSTAGRKERLL